MSSLTHPSRSNSPFSTYRGGRETVVFIVCLFLCFYLGFHLLAGERGYLRLLSLNATIQTQGDVLGMRQSERYALENKVKMMRPDTLDRDFVEERVRAVLGYTFPSESVILK